MRREELRVRPSVGREEHTEEVNEGTDVVDEETVACSHCKLSKGKCRKRGTTGHLPSLPRRSQRGVRASGAGASINGAGGASGTGGVVQLDLGDDSNSSEGGAGSVDWDLRIARATRAQRAQNLYRLSPELARGCYWAVLASLVGIFNGPVFSFA